MHLCSIEMSVNLGCSSEERAWPQIVKVTIVINFASPLQACKSDKITDTFCYDSFINELHNFTKNKEFNLIECLASEIYEFTKKRIILSEAVKISLTKYPPVKGLTGGVIFNYSDRFSCSC